MKIYVIGHVSPDLDAVASAVEYAEFLTKSKRYERAQIIPLSAEPANKETHFVFEKFGAKLPQTIEEVTIEPTDAFVLVDHNEETQRSPKVVNEQVIEIVDHHKINVNFTSPVRIDVKPLGSTSSIVYENAEFYGIELSKETKSLILAAVISDTQGLKSSTTTGIDANIAEKLCEELGIDQQKLTFEIFKAKSDLTGLSAQEIATKDFKVFDFGGKKVFIGQVETVEPHKVIEQKEQLVQALSELKSKHGAGQAYLIVTDILQVNSHAIYSTEEEKRVIEKAFTTIDQDGVANIGPKMSRKKDIAPAIEATISL